MRSNGGDSFSVFLPVALFCFRSRMSIVSTSVTWFGLLKFSKNSSSTFLLLKLKSNYSVYFASNRFHTAGFVAWIQLAVCSVSGFWFPLLRFYLDFVLPEPPFTLLGCEIRVMGDCISLLCPVKTLD